jgi:single-stranded-DNA-specific exonuclease
VIGIVASRLVERYRRPVVLIAVDDDEAKGSGRSIPAFDLHGGLAAASGHLRRFGGHRAAAGLTIDPAAIPAFAEALAEHAAHALDGADLAPRHRVDAVMAPAEVSLELIDELERLSPFGLGNPGVTLLAPAATLHGVERMGEGKHLRCAVELGGYRCRGVGFGMGGQAGELAMPGRYDVAYRIQRNSWNGSVTPQMLLRDVAPTPAGLEAPADGLPAPRSGCVPRVHDQRGGGVQIATIARYLAAGEPLLVLVADAGRRSAMLTGPLHPERLGGGPVRLAAYAELDGMEEPPARVVALDPPADPDQGAVLTELCSLTTVHLVWGPAEIEFARRVAEQAEPVRDVLAMFWRAQRTGAELPLAATTLERCRAVLAEVGLNGVVPAGKVDLEQSATYREALARVDRVRRFLASERVAV